MVLTDPLANMLSKMQNALRVGRNQIDVAPMSNFMLQVLELLKANGYVHAYEVKETTRGKVASVSGFETINKINVIKPRFNFELSEIIGYEQHYLPAKGFGIIIVSTSKGLMTLDSAKENHIGGKLIAYCY